MGCHVENWINSYLSLKPDSFDYEMEMIPDDVIEMGLSREELYKLLKMCFSFDRQVREAEALAVAAKDLDVEAARKRKRLYDRIGVLSQQAASQLKINKGLDEAARDAAAVYDERLKREAAMAARAAESEEQIKVG